MKNIIKYIYIILILVFMQACSDFIDLKPKDVLSENIAFQSFEDVELALTGTYGAMQGTGYLGRSYLFIPDVLADNASQPGENQGALAFLHNYRYEANSQDISAIWASLYIVIDRANRVLAQVDNFEASEEVIASVKGQALAIRAMAHFDLLRYFADNYSTTADASHLGVSIKTVGGEISLPSRNTVAEVYTQIDSDITEARTLLNGIDLPNTRLGYDAITALAARVALYKEDWQTANDLASEVISSGRSLATGSTYDNIWKEDEDGGTGELIFSLRYQTGETQVGNALYSTVNGNSLSWAPADNLLSSYDQTNDVRYTSFFQARETNPSQIVDGKYRGRLNGGSTPSNPGLNDVKVFRLSEMYLIRAEARAKGGIDGGDVAAMSDLNTLRTARIIGYTDQNLSGTTLQLAILDERRKELAFEGHRFFDLKRNNLPIVRGADCATSAATICFLEAGNYRFVFPIPQAEIFANPNMVQNSQY